MIDLKDLARKVSAIYQAHPASGSYRHVHCPVCKTPDLISVSSGFVSYDGNAFKCALPSENAIVEIDLPLSFEGSKTVRSTFTVYACKESGHLWADVSRTDSRDTVKWTALMGYYRPLYEQAKKSESVAQKDLPAAYKQELKQSFSKLLSELKQSNIDIVVGPGLKSLLNEVEGCKNCEPPDVDNGTDEDLPNYEHPDLVKYVWKSWEAPDDSVVIGSVEDGNLDTFYRIINVPESGEVGIHHFMVGANSQKDLQSGQEWLSRLSTRIPVNMASKIHAVVMWEGHDEEEDGNTRRLYVVTKPRTTSDFRRTVHDTITGICKDTDYYPYVFPVTQSQYRQFVNFYKDAFEHGDSDYL